MTAINSLRMALTRSELAAELSVSERHTYTLGLCHGFPKPRQLSASGSKPILRWVRIELEEWLRAQPSAAVVPEPAQLTARRFRDGKLIKS